METVENPAPRNSTDRMSETNVINLSDVVLDAASLSLLSKGLNFCVSNEFDVTEFQIDLGKSLRKLNLHKIFRNKEERIDTQKLSGENPVHIGPLGFMLNDEMSDVDKNAAVTLYDLLCGTENEFNEGIIQETVFCGGEKSTFFSRLVTGLSVGTI